jgi:hypothetical protein
MAAKKMRKKARKLKGKAIQKGIQKPKALAAPKRKRGKRKALALAPAAPVAKMVRKRGLGKARRKQLELARKKNFERVVTEKTLRDILALRCVQRCAH